MNKFIIFFFLSVLSVSCVTAGLFSKPPEGRGRESRFPDWQAVSVRPLTRGLAFHQAAQKIKKQAVLEKTQKGTDNNSLSPEEEEWLLELQRLEAQYALLDEEEDHLVNMRLTLLEKWFSLEKTLEKLRANHKIWSEDEKLLDSQIQSLQHSLEQLDAKRGDLYMEVYQINSRFREVNAQMDYLKEQEAPSPEDDGLIARQAKQMLERLIQIAEENNKIESQENTLLAEWNSLIQKIIQHAQTRQSI